MLAGAVSGFLIWAALVVAAHISSPNGQWRRDTLVILFVVLVGTGASIGWLVS